MSITITFNTDSITPTERRALVAFLDACDGTQPVLAVTAPQSDIKAGMTIADDARGVIRTVTSVHTAGDRELEQLTRDAADTQSTAAPAPASLAVPTDLAAIFGGAPAGSKPAWPFSAEPEQPAAPAPAVILDKNNLPWDARIHASSKAINADGSWRAKKMVDAVVVAIVEAELRATMGAPTPIQTVSVTDGSLIPANAIMSSKGTSGPASPQTYVPVAAQPAAPAPAQPTAPAAAPAVVGNPDTDLPVFLKEATTLINAGRATTADMIAAANSAGIPHPGALTQRPDLIATVRAAFMAKVTPVAVV